MTPLEPRGQIRKVVRDGQPVWTLRCPSCGHWGQIDDDQLHGRVSVNHGPGGPTGANGCSCGCLFHETRDWSTTAVTIDHAA